MRITPEEAFWLLADASGARRPNPMRETRGNCPAHGDSDPGLSFRITDEGNLVAHCFAQNCSTRRIAESIGLEVGSFFKRGGRRTGTYVPIEWTEMPVLELFKLVPFGYDHDTIVECVFDTLDLGLSYAEKGLSDMTKTEMIALTGIWLDPGYSFDDHGDWWDVQAALLRQLYALNVDTRTSPMQPESLIPRGT